MNFKLMSKEEMIALISEYDSYIQDANEQEKYDTGWKPVCVSEFYDNEFRLWKEDLLR